MTESDFEDLGDYLSPTLDLPVAGKVYSVPSPPAAVGLRLQASFAVSASRRAGQQPKQRHLARMVDDPATSLEQDSLGPVYDEMVADGVSLEALTHAGMTAYLWHVATRESALRYWRYPLGEASPPDRSTSTSTAEASTTKPRASSSGTKPPRKRSAGSRTTPAP